MNAPSNQQIARMLQGMIVERQRLLIREANYLRVLVGLPAARAERGRGDDINDANAVSDDTAGVPPSVDAPDERAGGGRAAEVGNE